MSNQDVPPWLAPWGGAVECDVHSDCVTELVTQDGGYGAPAPACVAIESSSDAPAGFVGKHICMCNPVLYSGGVDCTQRLERRTPIQYTLSHIFLICLFLILFSLVKRYGLRHNIQRFPLYFWVVRASLASLICLEVLVFAVHMLLFVLPLAPNKPYGTILRGIFMFGVVIGGAAGVIAVIGVVAVLDYAHRATKSAEKPAEKVSFLLKVQALIIFAMIIVLCSLGLLVGELLMVGIIPMTIVIIWLVLQFVWVGLTLRNDLEKLRSSLASNEQHKIKRHIEGVEALQRSIIVFLKTFVFLGTLWLVLCVYTLLGALRRSIVSPSNNPFIGWTVLHFCFFGCLVFLQSLFALKTFHDKVERERCLSSVHPSNDRDTTS